MSIRPYSAPGKAVICGEYAVLLGTPAVVMAVDRRACVSVRPAKRDEWTIETPGFTEGRRAFHVDENGAIDWQDELPPGGLPLVDAVFSVVEAGIAGPLEISIDTRAFVDAAAGGKLGLGSSAAATVALLASLVGKDASVDDIFSLARIAHRKLQDGRGSGIDVAASSYGGVIEYRRDSDLPPTRICWPADLRYRFFYSGQPADTVAAIDKVSSGSLQDEPWSSLAAAAEDAAAAFLSGDAATAFEAVANNTRVLRRFGTELGLDIFGAGHGAMADAAELAGVVFKPCGAGGGDIGIALTLDPAGLDGFSRQAQEIGFVPLDIHLDNSGI